ncbi:site-specific DNA-adenine methylase [Variovorax boronicumulans]|uniref:hypothetical protein n=1 Tax=Variovorax boronicumulans TaxID=436515 RepID=UPI00278A3751|nr:hypothetical protein [Variovorax boronicumulans]MDQ0085756.1 site-specific DNA-adenine methylase [Variovorax boronicumulans]
MQEDLRAVHLRLRHVTTERLDWSVCVERYDCTRIPFYFDPPWSTAGYDVPFGIEQCDHTAELLKSMKGKAVVSVNELPEMRLAFFGLKQRPPLSITYPVGAAEYRSPSRESLITNF